MAPRLIRRRPLAARIKAYLDPVDFMLWLSEELDSSDLDQWQKEWATPIGLILNFLFIIARANSRSSPKRTGDDVFGDDVGRGSFMSWFVRVIHATQAEDKLMKVSRHPSSSISSPCFHS